MSNHQLIKRGLSPSARARTPSAGVKLGLACLLPAGASGCAAGAAVPFKIMDETDDSAFQMAVGGLNRPQSNSSRQEVAAGASPEMRTIAGGDVTHRNLAIQPTLDLYLIGPAGVTWLMAGVVLFCALLAARAWRRSRQNKRECRYDPPAN